MKTFLLTRMGKFLLHIFYCFNDQIYSKHSGSESSSYELRRPKDNSQNRCDSPMLYNHQDSSISKLSRRERTFSFTKNATKAEPVIRTAQRTIYTAGRPPWYDTQGQSKECFLIGLS